MKKLLLAFGIVISLGLGTVQAQTVPETISIRDFVVGVSDTVNDIRGVVGVVSGTVDDVGEIWCIAKGDCKATPEGRFELPDPKKFNTIGDNVSLRQYILNVLNFVLSFLGLIAVVAMIYAGFLYVTSGGDDSANEKSKKIVIYAVIGILLILASYAIVNTVIRNAGVGTDDRNDISNTVNPNTGPVIPGTSTTPGASGTPIIPNLRNQLVNPLIIEGTSVQDGGDTIFVSSEEAREGLNFGLSVEAYAIIDFGDGIKLAIDTSLNPDLRVPHQYGEAGNYTVLALVQTADGQLSGFRKLVVVGGIEAKITGPQREVLVNTPVDISARSSSNRTGTITSYKWSCEDCVLSNDDTENITATFPNPGNKTVYLELTNSLNQSDGNSVTYKVVGDTPTAVFSGQSTSDTNRPGEFRFNANKSLNIKGEASGLTYNWSFNGVTRQTSSPEIIYNFPAPGSVNVELFVTQNFAGKTLTSETVSQTFEVPSTLSVDFDVY